MQIDIIEETGDHVSASKFPPDGDYSDLRENPQDIARMPLAREYLPLRNFLAALNGPDTIFATSDVATKSDSPAAVSGGAAAYEFASQVGIVFTTPTLNWERRHYAELCAALKELLERDASDAMRGALKISPCEFTAEKRSGFCLEVLLIAEGTSAQQAELRWGLGLARAQQALLFSSRVLKQQVGE
ncbi:MAG TPA: hypothetical protein VNY09_04510 [Candidatus Sulfotelmatobacter sp.]|nr:hypothetical protein [Candidatus Sulfotelmatobacter sp.]